MSEGKDKINQAVTSLLEMWQTGNMPQAVSRAIIARQHDKENLIPSNRWSLGNRILMWAIGKTEDARGFRQWEQSGRKVKKGAKAFYILGPMTRKVENESGEDRYIVTGFKAIPVFSVEDTDGKELEYPDYTPDNLPPLMDVADSFGIRVRWESYGGDGVLGAYSPSAKRIRLMTADEYTFFHELAHVAHERLCIKRGQDGLKPGQDAAQEIIADTAASVICQIYGIDGFVSKSWEYVRQYAGGSPENAMKRVMGLLTEIESVVEMIMTQHNKKAA